MSQYIRRYVPGGTYFFTVRLQDQRSDLLTARIGLLRDAVRLCRKQAPFRICSIPDDHIDPRRWALFAARWVLGDSRKEKRHARTTA
jgi:hypothetical protein